MKKNSINYIYVIVYGFISMLFLKLLYPYIVNSVFEYEYLNHLPWMLRDTEGLSGVKLLGYLIAPFPKYKELALVKVYAISVFRLLGPFARNYIFVSVSLHFANSVMLWVLCKRLRLSHRLGFFAGLMYLTLFAHFYAYIDPMATQHLVTVSFILLGLNLYLKSDELIGVRARGWRVIYALTLLINIFASFCIVSIALLPAIIFTHILFCAKDNKERARKYTIWLPLFVVYLVYPILPVISGHDKVARLLARFPASAGFAARLNMPARFLILFFSGLLCLLAFRLVLALCQRHGLRRLLKYIVITMAVGAAVFLLITGGPKRLLIPYNVLAPFVGIMASFLWPLENAFLVSPVHPWYPIPLQLGVFNFSMGLLILMLFMKYFVSQNRQCAVLIAWYFGAVMLFYLLNPVYSRYFIYLSPIFCIVFAAALDYFCATGPRLAAHFSLFIIVSLCIANIFAIRFTLFRGKLTNTFLTYDYVWAAETIKNDLISAGGIRQPQAKRLYVNGVAPIIIDADFPGRPDGYRCDPRNDNARFVFMHVFDDTSIDIAFNQEPKSGQGHIAYALDGYDLYGPRGLVTDAYRKFFEEGIKNLKAEYYTEALYSFKEAVRARPFMFDYILGDFEPEEGLEWITGADDMRQWVEKTRCFWVAGGLKKFNEKVNHVAFVLNKEIDTYILSLFYISFLEYSKGNLEESSDWFSKIRLFESEYGELHAWLSRQPLVMSKKDLSAFLNSRQDNALFYARRASSVERCKFAKFLFRLAFN